MTGATTTTGATSAPVVQTWADGFGIWHASVPTGPHAARTAAAAIRVARAPRGARVAPVRVVREGYASGSLCTRVIYGEATGR